MQACPKGDVRPDLTVEGTMVAVNSRDAALYPLNHLCCRRIHCEHNDEVQPAPPFAGHSPRAVPREMFRPTNSQVSRNAVYLKQHA
jgi:hypothetical protein